MIYGYNAMIWRPHILDRLEMDAPHITSIVNCLVNALPLPHATRSYLHDDVHLDYTDPRRGTKMAAACCSQGLPPV